MEDISRLLIEKYGNIVPGGSFESCNVFYQEDKFDIKLDSLIPYSLMPPKKVLRPHDEEKEQIGWKFEIDLFIQTPKGREELARRISGKTKKNGKSKVRKISFSKLNFLFVCRGEGEVHRLTMKYHQERK